MCLEKGLSLCISHNGPQDLEAVDQTLQREVIEGSQRQASKPPCKKPKIIHQVRSGESRAEMTIRHKNFYKVFISEAATLSPKQ